MDSAWWTAFGSLATAAGTLLTAIGLFITAKSLRYAANQIEQSKKIARAEFLLRLEDLFHDHLETHSRLRPGGEWAKEDGPTSPSDWIKVEKYLGLFERINVLVNDGIIDLNYVDDFYGYRVINLARNP